MLDSDTNYLIKKQNIQNDNIKINKIPIWSGDPH